MLSPSLRNVAVSIGRSRRSFQVRKMVFVASKKDVAQCGVLGIGGT